MEARVRLFNRTPLPQTFLWWANVAVRVHDRYQSFFPPDVTFVADHAKTCDFFVSNRAQSLLWRGLSARYGYFLVQEHSGSDLVYGYGIEVRLLWRV